MKTLMKTATLVSVGLLLASCSETNFSRQDKVAPPKPEYEDPPAKDHTIVSMGMDESLKGESIKVQTIDKVDFVIQAGDSRVLDENVMTKKQPLDLFFALDMTGSMGDEMNAVKDGITRLADELSRAGIDLKVGIVGFVDSYGETAARTFKLSADVNAFKSFITRITPQSNSDFPEASLYGIQQAVAHLQDGATSRADALKAVVLIADVVGHNGSLLGQNSPTRDCSTNKTVNDINAYAAKLASKEHFKFFYTVPDPAVVPNTTENAGAFKNCAGEDEPAGFTAIKQMQQIMDAILTDLPKEKRGGPLLDSTGKMAWPLTQNNLVNTLVPMLATNVTKEDVMGSCLARSADLYEAGKKVFSWSPEDLSKVNDAYRGAGNELRLPNVLGSTRKEGTQKLEMRVDRCCVSAEDIKTGNYSACYKTYTQVINYEVTSIKPVPQLKKK